MHQYEFMKAQEESELKDRLSKFAKEYTIEKVDYSPVQYQSNNCSKVWHCVMITYRSKYVK